MTVAATLTSVQYIGNGSATQFSFNNKIFAASDLVVTLFDLSGNSYPFLGPVNATLGLSYTVQNVDVDTGCLLVFNNPPTLGWTIDIRTDTPELQSTSIKNQGAFLPELHEEAFDRLTRIVQDDFRQTYTFGIHGPDTEAIPWPAMPAPAARLGMQIIFDPLTGLPTVGVPTTQPVTQGLILSLLTASGLGSVLWAATPAENAAGVVPVNLTYPPGALRRYGADPTGGTPSDTALASACLCNADVFDDYPGGGTYLFNTGITISSYPLRIRGQCKFPGSKAGVPNGTEFVIGAGVITALIYATTAIYGLEISGIGFSFASLTSGARAIRISNDCRYSLIERCWFGSSLGATQNSSTVAIQFDSSAIFTGDVIIRDNFFQNCGFAAISLQGACSTVKIYGNEFYGHGGVKAIQSWSTLTGGSGYTTGNYTNVALTGGSGSGALADIVVTGGVVTAVYLVSSGGGYAAGDTISSASIGAGSGFSLTGLTVGDGYGYGVQAVAPVTEPLIAHNYFEGLCNAIYSSGASYLKQIGNDYGPNVNHFLWWKTISARIWNQSLGETFAGSGNTIYPLNNTDFCQVLSGPGTYSLDGAFVQAYQGFKEQGRVAANGHQQTRAFAAGNYTGGGGWTVTTGQVTADVLVVDGNHATYYFEVIASTVTGGNATLTIALPPGVTASARSTTACRISDNGAAGIGVCEVSSGGTSVNIYKDATTTANWAAATTNTTVQGQISFPIAYSVN